MRARYRLARRSRRGLLCAYLLRPLELTVKLPGAMGAWLARRDPLDQHERRGLARSSAAICASWSPCVRDASRGSSRYRSAPGLGQAIGVLLLIPLLAAVGVGGSTSVSRSVRGLLEDVGVSPTLGAVLALYVAVIAASAALSAYQSVLSTRYRLEFVDEIRERLYGAVARAEWRHLIELRQSDLLAVLTTNVSWVGFGAAAALSIAATAIIAVAQLAAAIRISRR